MIDPYIEVDSQSDYYLNPLKIVELSKTFKQIFTRNEDCRKIVKVWLSGGNQTQKEGGK